ncbi:DUF3817 domain-containing protein [Aquimarina sp. U1-2]|uniref:DUF3817 domain-containing protein n=1 Tax=Aquimarina sp. U1-2 TaxID=2823141 RepID=UPI001AECBB5E|nr:DUF3817 domain-containing protein [Aquimarina sp. U1-2]MBP2831970.1 DUF3817 domain-containing protein [Aquimarina sp. U1-2]
MITSFRIISYLEGISYILILFVTMPLKYIFESPEPNKVIGMAHGILFLLYIVFTFVIRQEKQWDTKTLWIVLLCSIIPFGTFWMDRKYLST